MVVIADIYIFPWQNLCVSNPSHMENVEGWGMEEKGEEEFGGETLDGHKLLFLSDAYLYQATELCHSKHDEIPNSNCQQPGCLEYRLHARGSLEKTQICE